MTQEAIAIQARVDAVLAAPVGRFDAAGRLRRIRAAVVKECADVGFAEANMAAIAKSAGVSTATLYRSFADKNELFLDALAYAAPLITETLTQPITSTDPFVVIRNGLIQHGRTLAHPYLTWLYTTFLGLEGQIENNPRDATYAGLIAVEQHWHKVLINIEKRGYLKQSDHFGTVTQLLGPMERVTLVSRILFGPQLKFGLSIKDVAQRSTEDLFDRLGTEHYRTCRRNGRWPEVAAPDKA